jgi:hypothetical protein
MTLKTIEARVAKLEKQLAALQAEPVMPVTPAPAKDWRRTIGMFTGDDVMAEILDEGRKWRAAERRKARGGSAKAKPKGRH